MLYTDKEKRELEAGRRKPEVGRKTFYMYSLASISRQKKKLIEIIVTVLISRILNNKR